MGHIPQVLQQGHQSEVEMRIKSEQQDSEWPPDRAHMGDMPVQTVMEERPSASPEAADNNHADNAPEESSHSTMDSKISHRCIYLRSCSRVISQKWRHESFVSLD